jgi:uncharacterized protein
MTPATVEPAAMPDSLGSRKAPSRRSFWIRQIVVWHWVSSGVCLGGMLLFTVTGITLNHAGEISATPRVRTEQVTLPDPLRKYQLP